MDASVQTKSIQILLDLLSDYKRDERLSSALIRAKELSQSSDRIALQVLDLIERLDKYNIKRIRREAVDYAKLLLDVSGNTDPDIKKNARKTADKIFIAFVSRLFKDRAMMFEVVTWQDIFTCMDDMLAVLTGEKSEVA